MLNARRNARSTASSALAIATAAIAAVSARRMVSPSEAAIHCEVAKLLNSSSVQPPSGPTARANDVHRRVREQHFAKRGF